MQQVAEAVVICTVRNGLQTLFRLDGGSRKRRRYLFSHARIACVGCDLPSKHVEYVFFCFAVRTERVCVFVCVADLVWSHHHFVSVQMKPFQLHARSACLCVTCRVFYHHELLHNKQFKFVLRITKHFVGASWGSLVLLNDFWCFCTRAHTKNVVFDLPFQFIRINLILSRELSIRI